MNAIASRPSIEKIYLLADTVYGSKENFAINDKIEALRVWTPDKPLSILAILTYIIRIRPDVVHFNTHYQSYGRTRLANFAGFSLVFLSRMLGLKTVVLLHNLGEKVDLKKVKIKPSMLNRAGILVATKLALSASILVVPVQSYAQYLRQRYGHKAVQYIPHGTPLYTNLHHKSQKEKAVLMFGHMGPSKGLPVIFQAFEEITKEQNDLKLIVAGDSHPNYPNYLNDMAKSAPKGTNFLGYVQEQDLPRIFGMADIIVLPYYTATGTSGVFHLSCGFGKPVVASSLPEIKELVEAGASALLVPPGDVDALKKALIQILSNNDLAAEMSEQNLAFAKKEQWDFVAEKYEKAYLKLLNLREEYDGEICMSIAPSCDASNNVVKPIKL